MRIAAVGSREAADEEQQQVDEEQNDHRVCVN